VALLLEALIVTKNVQPARNSFDRAAERAPLSDQAAPLLAAVRDLAPSIAARADEIERSRRVPSDIVEALRRIGVFRMLVPHSHGGLALSVPEAVPVVEALSAIDSSVGWVTMIAVTSQTFCTRLSRAAYDRLYADHPDVVVVGVGTPVGRAEKVNGGYRITGRWPFASGCQNAQWIVGHCVLYQDGEPMMSGDGPQTRFFMLPAANWRIEETWQASGLTGSGSHHVILEDFDAPDTSAFDLVHGLSCVPGPFEAAVTPFLGTFHAAVAVGIAAGALADLASMAGAGRRQLFAATNLRDSPVFQHEFGRVSAAQRAAQALLDVQAANHWRRAVAGTLDGKVDFAESLQASAWIHAACAGIVSACYTLGGSSVVLNSSPLQRRLRDIHAARQHVFAQERFYAIAGANHLGFPPVDPISGR
jgi:alkylation response protein AidB-like acyl-CoA dehydrogenase